MKLLAVETSTAACSAALYLDGEILERYALAPKTHTQLLLPMIDELMSKAGLCASQLDAVAFSCGPGSFTGVRIATGVIQGIAFGADLPVVPVSTLAALAQAFLQQPKVTLDVAFTAMDARIGEIFCGVYQRNADGYAQLLGQEQVIAPQLLQLPLLEAAGIGSAWGIYREVLLAGREAMVREIDAACLPRASAIAQLGVYGFNQGQAVAVEQAMPVYLRDKVAQTEAERRSARGG